MKLHKDEHGLPYINLEGSCQEAATMLVQMGVKGVHFTSGREVRLACGSETQTGRTHVQMVWENYEGFMKKDVIKAKEARQAQGLIGNPSKKDFKGMVSNHLIPNCPVTYDAITNAQKTFGPDLASIRGKPVQRTPEPVVADYVAIPCPVIEQNRIATMAADVFFMDGTAFLITMSRRIKFVTA